jgi:hypothetical protein
VTRGKGRGEGELRGKYHAIRTHSKLWDSTKKAKT